MKRAFDVGAHEGRGAVDAAVDMAFRSEVNQSARPMLDHQTVDQRAVGDVATLEVVVGMCAQGRQAFQVARIGKSIEIDDRLIALSQPVENEVAANEASTSSDEQGHSGNLSLAR